MNYLFRLFFLAFVTITFLCCKKTDNKNETENNQSSINVDWGTTSSSNDEYFNNFSKYVYYGANLDDHFVDDFGIVDYNDSLIKTLDNPTLETEVKKKVMGDTVFLRNLIVDYLNPSDNDASWPIWWAHKTNSAQDLAILYLSKHRQSTDFQTGYNILRKVFLKNISTEEYIENIRPTLNNYLDAFDILNNTPTQIDSLYRYLYREPLGNNGISEYPNTLLYFDHETDDQENNLTDRYVDSSDAYSFWIRRINDGNVESIYRTMMSFKRDFDNKIKNPEEEEWVDYEIDDDEETINVIWDEGRDMDIDWEYSNCLLDNNCEHTETYNNDVKDALNFAVDNNLFYSFSLNEGYEWPIYYKVLEITNNETGETETKTVDKDLSEREVIRSNESLENAGDYVYSCIVEYLSINRYSINFEQLYIRNADLIREIITPHIYKERYQEQVDILINAYKIFDNLTEEQKQLLIDTYQLDTDRWADETASDLFDSFEKQLSAENDISKDSSAAFYVSSFWARRYNEDIKLYNDTYNTLQKIKENYE